MAVRRLIYLAALGLCFVFYIAYGQWLSWLILVAVLALPWFSLLLSLPAMLRFRASPSGPCTLSLGEEGELGRIVGHGHHDLVEDGQAAADEGQMPVGQGVESAGIECQFHASVHISMRV